ncbi:AHH domain-containing protein [Pyxidicoccus parkwayensis]|uniref:AHH domain-containing protein n=1 Tax=Pyxidicoccus parkwayensis TaxID=2813578 RepID=A0ABX7NXW3_9BACT|nr:AHH domain-containing protein [Pyxidicoccus parkwaysis]QSQ23714.1 AHH domain-containing protein [Pyxidicoccus parkwaysis]
MAEDDHILSSMPIRARLGRSSDYRQAGHAALAGNPGRRVPVYDNDAKILGYLRHYNVSPSSAAIPKHSAAHAALYHFEQFLSGQKPYPNAAHHLVPCETFTPDVVFTEDELEILKRVLYDVNNGGNIIFLPSFSNAVEVYALTIEARRERVLRYCNVHRLPAHLDCHKDYTALVKADCADLKRLLRGQLVKVCADWKPPQSIPEELFRLQDRYWEYIVRFGESRPLGQGATINALIKLKPVKPRWNPGGADV